MKTLNQALCTSIICVGLLGSFGCASTSARGGKVRDLDESSAKNCQYLGDVMESQYSGMLFAGSGLEAARAKVRDSAAALGATHVVWTSLAAGGAVQAASAKAYACPDPSEAPASAEDAGASGAPEATGASEVPEA